MVKTATKISKSTPRVIKQIPKDVSDATVRSIRIDNGVTVAFSLLNPLSVALGAYATMVFTLMSIYSKTALGLVRVT